MSQSLKAFFDSDNAKQALRNIKRIKRSRIKPPKTHYAALRTKEINHICTKFMITCDLNIDIKARFVRSKLDANSARNTDKPLGHRRFLSVKNS